MPQRTVPVPRPPASRAHRLVRLRSVTGALSEPHDRVSPLTVLDLCRERFMSEGTDVSTPW